MTSTGSTMRRVALIAALVSSGMLGGCSMLHDRTEDYVKQEQAGPLHLPDWYDSQRIKPIHPVPSLDRNTVASGGTFVLPKPPDLTSDILEEDLVVQEAGEQAWLLVNELPGRVWPSVSGFLGAHGVSVSIENPRIGLMQSEPVNNSLKTRQWLALKDEEMRPSVLQARISPGVRRHTTEVQFRLRQLDEKPDGMLGWQSGSEHQQLEKRLLTELATYMKGQEGDKAYSRLALEMKEEPRIRLVNDQPGEPFIALDLSHERAWAEISRALSEANVPVVDINRGEGLWYVDFRTEDEREGGWFFWARDNSPQYTFLVKLARVDGQLRLTTAKAPDYDGTDRSMRLLSEIYERLY
ncbi:outer membrane protein assembly factor BamC [Marinobacteraceae bacterium S3BR75-40.1]